MTVHFAKYSGCGNDFIMIDARSHLSPSRIEIQEMCDRNHGIGADGVILLERSTKAHLKMRIFNLDGSEADMCGNGIRCLHAFARELNFPSTLTIETASGIYTTTEIEENESTDPNKTRFVQVKIEAPKLSVKSHTINGIKCDSTFTGNPHVVCNVENLQVVDVNKVGRLLRYHPDFNPAGTNVNFFQIEGKDKLAVRTYEKGVERETLACGTGAIAAAYVYATKEGSLSGTRTIQIKTRSGESLTAKFVCELGEVISMELSGPARKIFEGNILLKP